MTDSLRQPRQENRPSFRDVLARDGPAVLVAAAITLAVELGVFFLARAAGTDRRNAVLATLATVVLWVALAAPAFACSGRTTFSALLRGGIVADASAVALLVLWLATPYVTFLAAVEIYCILAAVALATAAAVLTVRPGTGRTVAAVVAASILVLALASPFWIGGLLQETHGEAKQAVVTWAVAANPFYSILSAVVDETAFVWHLAPVMYRITRIGDYAAPPPIPWYSAVVVYGILALMLAATHLLRRRPQPAPPA